MLHRRCPSINVCIQQRIPLQFRADSGRDPSDEKADGEREKYNPSHASQNRKTSKAKCCRAKLAYARHRTLKGRPAEIPLQGVTHMASVLTSTCYREKPFPKVHGIKIWNSSELREIKDHPQNTMRALKLQSDIPVGEKQFEQKLGHPQSIALTKSKGNLSLTQTWLKVFSLFGETKQINICLSLTIARLPV